MFASPFAYHRATTIADASRLLAENPGAKLLAGGHSLLPLLKLRLAAPEALVDIGRVAELKGIAEKEGRIRIDIAGADVPRFAPPDRLVALTIDLGASELRLPRI